jgi:hypothetical protein
MNNLTLPDNPGEDSSGTFGDYFQLETNCINSLDLQWTVSHQSPTPTSESRSVPPSNSMRSKDKSSPAPSSADNQALKRHRNNIAARKYRQKKLDRISELEEALLNVTREKDELKVQLARREAEVQVLRDMLSR